jgi:hypothetical protein
MSELKLKKTDSVSYLVFIITTEGGVEVGVRNGLNRARAAFTTLKPDWDSTKLKTMTKLRTFSSSVRSVLLYAWESWLVPKKVTNLLHSFVNRCLRRILKIHWPTVSQIKTVADIPTGSVRTGDRRRKWKWLRHTLRMP